MKPDYGEFFSKEQLEKCKLNWLDLNGKILRIQVCQDNINLGKGDKTCLTVFGQDVNTDQVYLLFQEAI